MFPRRCWLLARPLAVGGLGWLIDCSEVAWFGRSLIWLIPLSLFVLFLFLFHSCFPGSFFAFIVPFPFHPFYRFSFFYFFPWFLSFFYFFFFLLFNFLFLLLFTLFNFLFRFLFCIFFPFASFSLVVSQYFPLFLFLVLSVPLFFYSISFIQATLTLREGGTLSDITDAFLDSGSACVSVVEEETDTTNMTVADVSGVFVVLGMFVVIAMGSWCVRRSPIAKKIKARRRRGRGGGVEESVMESFAKMSRRQQKTFALEATVKLLQESRVSVIIEADIVSGTRYKAPLREVGACLPGATQVEKH